MSSPNLRGAKARPSFGMPATPKDSRVEVKAVVTAANKLKNKEGNPILFAANEGVTGAVPVS